MTPEEPPIAQTQRTRPDGPGTPVRILHPGPPAPDRIQWARGRLHYVETELQTGLTILDAIAQALAPHTLTAAALHFEGLALEPMRYVRPAYSDDGDRVAFYSRTFAPEGPVAMDHVAATFGSKDGAPFIHCHALWTDDAGRTLGGHILPHDAIVARPAKLIAWGTRDAAMQVAEDPETHFPLFGVANGDRGTKGRLILARIRPNEDLVTAIEVLCDDLGVTEARIRSGIGSTIGAQLDGQPELLPIPTELLISDGHVTTDDEGRQHADLPTALIDVEGAIHTGRPQRGENPVLIVFELVIEDLSA